jgi:hypothetical protein
LAQGAALYLVLSANAFADFSSCGKTSDQLVSFRDRDGYIELAAAYTEECAGQSLLLGEGQVFLDRIRGAEDAASRRTAVRQAVLLLESQLNDETLSGGEANSTALAVMRKELECERYALESQEALRRADCENNLESRDGTVMLQKWWPRAGEGPVFEESFVVPFFAAHEECRGMDPTPGSACDRVFDREFLPVLEFQSVMHSQVRPAANQKPAEVIAADYSALHERWKSYLSDTGFQYPWELTLNRKFRGGFEEVARREDAPTSRYIVAHPTLAVAYSDASPDGSQTRLMGVVKIVGYKWWKYSGRRAKNVWGISATATLADLPEVNDTGIGIMVEYDQFAIGWSSHGGDSVVSLSLDLGAVLRGPDSLEGWLSKLGK